MGAARSEPPAAEFRLQAHRKRALRPSPSVRPFLSVVMVNYCQWRNTARLTRQLRQSHAARADDAEVVIVDNHSPKHGVFGKLRRAKGVSVRCFGSNLGFAGAVNEGSQIARGDLLLLLNPDMSVSPGFLDDVEAFA